ncbi:pepsin/retropepsin-like aspartic protease family protein [Sphingomonas limnosediminicola]
MILVAAPAAADPLVFDNGRLFITAQVNGLTTEALLDSAAEASLIDPVFAAKAKLAEGAAQTIRGSGGGAKARVVEGVMVEALGLTLHPEAVVVTDLSELSRRLIKRPTQVVIGRELFDAARLRVDIGRREAIVVNSAGEPKGQRLSLTKVHGVEAIEVVASGVTGQAEVDLGNGSGLLISRSFANKLKLKTIGRKPGGGIGGEVQRDLVRLASLDVAGKRYRDLVAAVDDQPTASDLNIGTSILKDFVLTTDFSQRAVWLDPAVQGR